MRFLNNLKIVTKVGLIVAVLGLVIVSALGLSLLRMTELTGTFTDLINKDDAGTLSVVRASRRAEGYRMAAFAVLTETTEAGNAKQLESSRTSKADFDKYMDQAKVFEAKAGETISALRSVVRYSVRDVRSANPRRLQRRRRPRKTPKSRCNCRRSAARSLRRRSRTFPSLLIRR